MRAVVFLAAVCGVSTDEAREGGTAPEYITELDQEVSDNAKTAAVKWCAGGFRGEVSATRDDLAAWMGGSNVVQEALEKGPAHSDLQEFAQEEIMKPWFLERATGTIMAVLTAVVWLICYGCSCLLCWCKRCSKDRGVGLPYKCCWCVVMSLVFVVVVVTMHGTEFAQGTVKDGADNLLCSGSKLLNTSLNGGGIVGDFIGVMPVLEKFQVLHEQLEDGSTLQLELKSILEETEGIEDALVLVADLVKLLNNMLSPHQGYQLQPLVVEISEMVQKGVGNTLFQARKAVESQLTKSNRMHLQQMLRQGADPMVKMKGQVGPLLKELVREDAADVKEQYEGYFYLSFLFVHMAGILLVLAGCGATCWVAARPAHRDGSYSTGPSRVACCVCCCSFPFLFVTFLLSGVMSAVLIPVSGACVLMQDLDGALLRDIAPGIGVGTAPAGSESESAVVKREDLHEMAGNVVDTCWAGKGANSSNLLDLIFIREYNHTSQKHEEKVYLRGFVVENMQAPVDAAFADLQAARDSGSVTLADKEEFTRLKRKLQRFDGDDVMRGEDEFRCDVFRFPQNGTFCDPISMVQRSNGTWGGDCLRHHRNDYTFTEEMEKTCTMNEFVQYIQDYSTRLDIAIKRLDHVTVQYLDVIAHRLRNLVHTYLLDHIKEVADGLSCGFLPVTVQEVLDSLCYQIAPGLHLTAHFYLICGFVISVLAIDMYFLYRFIYSNVEAQKGKGLSAHESIESEPLFRPHIFESL